MGACGGGGGGAASVGSLPPSSFETQEYSASYGLGAIHASSAYAGGATGQSVTVAVIDTGIDVDHPEFAGAIHPDSIDIVTGGPTFDDADGHGTAVAGVIGARRNGALSHGVAYQSQLLVVRADALSSCGPAGCAFMPADVAVATDHAVDHGARVVNYSLGGASPLDPVLEDALDRGGRCRGHPGHGRRERWRHRADLSGTLAADAQADGLAIAVGSVDANDQLASSSNRAGSAQDHYLVAPGVNILAPAPGGGAALRNGTLFAAPHVAGAAAVVLQAAPFLSGAQVVELLLDTATDWVPPGEISEYGRGMVDLDAALSRKVRSRSRSARRSRARPCRWPVPVCAWAPHSARARSSAGRSSSTAMVAPTGWISMVGPTAASLPDLHDWLAPAVRPRVAGARLDGLEVALGVSSAEEELGAGGVVEGEANERDAIALSASLGEFGRLDLLHGWSLQGRFGLSQAAPGVLDGLVSYRSLSSPYIGLTRGGEGVALTQELGGGLSLRTGVASERTTGLAGRRQGTRALVAELSQETRAGTWVGLQLGSVSEREAMDSELRRRKALEQDLHHALERGELELEYQPQIDIASRRMIGIEALLRWQHPEHGRIPPDRFIPLAEDNGLIVPIGDCELARPPVGDALDHVGQVRAHQPVPERFCRSSFTRSTVILSASVLMLTPVGTALVSSPFGPLTLTDPSFCASVTPLGSGITFRPIRLIAVSLPDFAEKLAARGLPCGRRGRSSGPWTSTGSRCPGRNAPWGSCRGERTSSARDGNAGASR